MEKLYSGQIVAPLLAPSHRNTEFDRQILNTETSSAKKNTANTGTSTLHAQNSSEADIPSVSSFNTISTPQPHAPAAPPLSRSEILAIKSRSVLSIIGMMDASSRLPQQKNNDSSVLEEPFSQQDLLSAWEAFTQASSKEKRTGLYTALCAADVTVEENYRVHISVSSSTAARELEQNMLDILSFLRKMLRNTHIFHLIEVRESIREWKPYTPREKYEYLCRKNPLLEKMRGDLDLNIDF